MTPADTVSESTLRPNVDLVFAAEDGDLEQVRRLLEQGADIDEPDQHGCTALQLAFAEGHGEIVNLLLDKGAETGVTDEEGFCLLHWAVFSGDVDFLQQANHLDGEIERRDQEGRTPLSWTSGREVNWAEGAAWLLEQGADLETADNDGWTPLHHAASADSLGVLRCLLKAGADPEACDSKGRTPTDVAASESVVRLLKG